MSVKKYLLLLFALIVLLTVSSCEIGYNKQYEPGNVWFIGFGADYTDCKNIPDLDKPIADVIEMGKAFRSLAEKAGVGYKDIYFMGKSQGGLEGQQNVHGYTWSEYQSVLRNEVKPEDNDIVICYFSCHGNEFLNDVVYYGSDYAFEGNQIVFKDVFVEYGKVFNLIDSLNGSKLIIADSCYSGSFIVGNGVVVDKNEYSTAPIRLLFDSGIKINQSPSTWVITGGTQEQPLAQEYRGHGVITYFILDALGWNEETQSIGNVKAMDGNFVSAGSIANYVYSHGANGSFDTYRQNPMFGAGSSDLILFRF